MSELDLAIANSRIDELTAQVERIKKEKQAVISQLAEANRVIKEMTECKNKDTDIAKLQKHADELQSKLTMSVSEIEHFKKMYEDCKNSFDVLYEGSKAIDQSLKDEKQKNEECMNIITELTKAVLNLSDVIE